MAADPDLFHLALHNHDGKFESQSLVHRVAQQHYDADCHGAERRESNLGWHGGLHCQQLADHLHRGQPDGERRRRDLCNQLQRGGQLFDWGRVCGSSSYAPSSSGNFNQLVTNHTTNPSGNTYCNPGNLPTTGNTSTETITPPTFRFPPPSRSQQATCRSL